MLITHHKPRPDRAAALIAHAAERRLDDYLDGIDRAAARDDLITTLAAEIWDRDIGARIRFAAIDEAVSETFAGFDADEQSELEDALAQDDDAALGALFRRVINDYLAAKCAEQARQQLDKLEREAEDDHYREQVAS